MDGSVDGMWNIEMNAFVSGCVVAGKDEQINVNTSLK